MNSSTEKRYRITGFSLSLLIHAALLLLCYFFFHLYPPNPPLSDFGLSVNFGTDPAGFGEVQTLEPAGENTQINPDEAISEPVQNTPEPTPPSPETKEELLTTDNPESPAEVKKEPEPEKKKEKKEKPEPKKPEEKKEKPSEKPKTEVKADKKSDRKPDSDVKAGNNNNGNKKGAVGDQGHPEGSLDERLNYDGKPQGKGRGTGTSLDMTGWKWDSKPEPKESSDEEGKIVFEVTVDENGDIIKVRTLEKTVSPALEKIYRKEVEALTFSKTRDNVKPASESTGKITFIIRSR